VTVKIGSGPRVLPFATTWPAKLVAKAVVSTEAEGAPGGLGKNWVNPDVVIVSALDDVAPVFVYEAINVTLEPGAPVRFWLLKERTRGSACASWQHPITMIAVARVNKRVLCVVDMWRTPFLDQQRTEICVLKLGGISKVLSNTVERNLETAAAK